MIEMCDEIDPAWVGPRRGDGVFTTIRVKDGAAFDWSAHIARLRRHGEAYGLGPLPSEEAVAAASGRRLADAALSEGEAILRLALWRTHAGRDGASQGAAMVTEVFSASPTPSRVRSLTIAEESSVMAEKAAAYGPRFRARADARKAGCDDALFLGPDGRVTAAVTANVFALRAGVLVTPPVGPGVLPGTARTWLLDVAADIGVSVETRPLTLDEAALADGLFLTNASMGPLAAHMQGARPSKAHRELTERLRTAWRERLPERPLLA